MADWKKLATALLVADTSIDDRETALLRAELMDDGKIDTEEMHFLIGLRNAVSSTCESFESFFFEAFKAFLLKDAEIDAVETELIRSVIYADGKISEQEKQFLKELANLAVKLDNRFKILCQECGVDI